MDQIFHHTLQPIANDHYQYEWLAEEPVEKEYPEDVGKYQLKVPTNDIEFWDISSDLSPGIRMGKVIAFEIHDTFYVQIQHSVVNQDLQMLFTDSIFPVIGRTPKGSWDIAPIPYDEDAKCLYPQYSNAIDHDYGNQMCLVWRTHETVVKERTETTKAERQTSLVRGLLSWPNVFDDKHIDGIDSKIGIRIINIDKKDKKDKKDTYLWFKQILDRHSNDFHYVGLYGGQDFVDQKHLLMRLDSDEGMFCWDVPYGKGDDDRWVQRVGFLVAKDGLLGVIEVAEDEPGGKEFMAYLLKNETFLIVDGDVSIHSFKFRDGKERKRFYTTGLRGISINKIAYPPKVVIIGEGVSNATISMKPDVLWREAFVVIPIRDTPRVIDWIQFQNDFKESVEPSSEHWFQQHMSIEDINDYLSYEWKIKRRGITSTHTLVFSMMDQPYMNPNTWEYKEKWNVFKHMNDDIYTHFQSVVVMYTIVVKGQYLGLNFFAVDFETINPFPIRDPAVEEIWRLFNDYFRPGNYTTIAKVRRKWMKIVSVPTNAFENRGLFWWRRNDILYVAHHSMRGNPSVTRFATKD